MAVEANPILLIILSFAVSAISLTLARSKVFESLRRFTLAQNRWMGELISCPYCLSHWISILLVIVYRPETSLHVWMPLDIVVSAFVIVGFGSLIIGAVSRILFRDPTQEETIHHLREALKEVRTKIQRNNKP